MIGCTLAESVSQESLELVFTPNTNTFSDSFRLTDKESRLTIQVTKKLDQEKFENTKKSGETLSGLNAYAGGAGEIASIGLTFLNLDPSGNMMKISQM